MRNHSNNTYLAAIVRAMATRLQNFNPDLIRIVAQYLSHQDQLRLFVINQFHHESSKLYRYVKLNSINSKHYVNDKEFQEHCLSLIKSSSRQLGLNLAGCRDISDVSALGGVHTLDLSGCGNIHDVSALGGVHSLNLSGCQGISDVSALGGVHSLNLSGCQGIHDVSALGCVHTLDLSRCAGISDVSALGGVHTLDLINCPGIRDVSALGGVHSL
jgi:hypothetical protein